MIDVKINNAISVVTRSKSAEIHWIVSESPTIFANVLTDQGKQYHMQHSWDRYNKNTFRETISMVCAMDEQFIAQVLCQSIGCTTNEQLRQHLEQHFEHLRVALSKSTLIA